MCGGKDNFNHNDCPKGIRKNTERKFFFNEMWEQKPHTKIKKRTLSRNIHYNSPHGNVNNLHSSHLKRNHDLKHYQPQNKDNKMEINLDENRPIENIPARKKKKEGELK